MAWVIGSRAGYNPQRFAAGPRAGKRRATVTACPHRQCAMQIAAAVAAAPRRTLRETCRPAACRQRIDLVYKWKIMLAFTAQEPNDGTHTVHWITVSLDVLSVVALSATKGTKGTRKGTLPPCTKGTKGTKGTLPPSSTVHTGCVRCLDTVLVDISAASFTVSCSYDGATSASR